MDILNLGNHQWLDGWIKLMNVDFWINYPLLFQRDDERNELQKPYLHVLNAIKYSHAWALSMSGIGRVYPGFG
jgi:hypothetical protein